MGLLEWLGLRREAPKKQEEVSPAPSSGTLPNPSGDARGEQKGEPAGNPKGEPLKGPEMPSFKKPAEWRLPRDDLRFKSDSEKINYILQGVYSIYDELKPMADDGTRVSRLQLLLENLTPYEREQARKTIEDLDIDNLVIKFLDYPKSIEEISESIKKSYGYTAARLRHLRALGKVARLRDPVTNKYKYTRLLKGESEKSEIPDELLPGSLEADSGEEEIDEGPFPEGTPFSEGRERTPISSPAEPSAQEPLSEPIILEGDSPKPPEGSSGSPEDEKKSPESPV